MVLSIVGGKSLFEARQSWRPKSSDLASTLTDSQLGKQSLCADWIH